jgi:hypothetical protein
MIFYVKEKKQLSMNANIYLMDRTTVTLNLNASNYSVKAEVPNPQPNKLIQL